MATMGGIFCPDYDGTQAPATGYVGTLAQNANTGAIILGKYRLWKLTFQTATAGANSAILRFTVGNSVLGHTATTPVSTSPFLHNFHENFFELDGSFDSINLANLDNGATGLVYCFLPLIRN